VRHKLSILVLGVLCSNAPAAAQTALAQFQVPEKPVVPTMAMLRRVSTPLAGASFLMSRDAGTSPVHLSILFVGVHERDLSPVRVGPIEDVQTLFFAQSSLPLVQLWGTRLRLDAFQSTLLIQNVQPGPFGYRPGQRSYARQGYLGDPSVIGLSLSYRFGRAAGTRSMTQVWRRMTRFWGAVLN
jgi:hypothetical protein